MIVENRKWPIIALFKSFCSLIETIFTLKFYPFPLLFFGFLNSISVSIGQIPEGETAITASFALPASSTTDFNHENRLEGSPASLSEGEEGNGTGEFIQIELCCPDNFTISDDKEWVWSENIFTPPTFRSLAILWHWDH